MGVDHCGFSPRVPQKIVPAGVNSRSFQQASRDLAELADLDVKPKPVERLVRRIGQERIDQRDAAVATHQRLPLMAKDALADPKRPCPPVAMASVDGGRLPIRSEPSEPTHEGHWRESNVAVLETHQSAVHPVDPDPDVPRGVLDLKRTKELVRGLGHTLPLGLEFASDDRPAPPSGTGEPERDRPSRPVRAVPSVWSAVSWRAGRAPTTLARWGIRRPESGTSSGRSGGRSWGTGWR